MRGKGPRSRSRQPGSADLPPRFEKVFDSFPLTDCPREQEGAAGLVTLCEIGLKALDVGRVGNDADPLGRQTVANERLGDVLGRDQDPVGQLQFAEPAVVQPDQLVAVP